jgi:hypothetical protein
LLDEFGSAVRELLAVHEQQFLAILDGMKIVPASIC